MNQYFAREKKCFFLESFTNDQLEYPIFFPSLCLSPYFTTIFLFNQISKNSTKIKKTILSESMRIVLKETNTINIVKSIYVIFRRKWCSSATTSIFTSSAFFSHILFCFVGEINASELSCWNESKREQNSSKRIRKSWQ